MSKRKTYTDEFKIMIAELVLSGKTVREVADEYGLSQTAIRNWVKKKTPIDVKGDTTNLEEILKIKKENARLKEENDILKNVIIPYIHSYFEKNKQLINPFINVAKINNKIDIKKIKMPEKKDFLIESLDIIRGEPIKRRHGPSSYHDDMKYSIVHKYIFYGDKI